MSAAVQSSSVVTLYTLPSCVQCYATKKYLDDKKIDYAVVDMSQDEDAYEFVKSLGYLQAPVVVAGNSHWSGFKPEMISKFANI